MRKLISFIGIAIVAAGAWAFLFQDEKPAAAKQEVKFEPVASPEPAASVIITPHPTTPRKPTLDPAMFQDESTHAAYKVAKDKPELLEHMACYCGCMRSMENHTSNLECFADSHGVGCALCRRIALDASEMHEKGMTVEAIKKEIDSRYAK